MKIEIGIDSINRLRNSINNIEKELCTLGFDLKERNFGYEDDIKNNIIQLREEVAKLHEEIAKISTILEEVKNGKINECFHCKGLGKVFLDWEYEYCNACCGTGKVR